jgi:hypothetical protein
MADENVKNVADKGENLLSDLHTLLEEQIRLAHKGDMILKAGGVHCKNCMRSYP